MKLGIACLIFAVTLGIGTSWADLIVDNGTITRAAGLEWLDLSLTAGFSYNEVVLKEEFDGWRHATTAEVEGLYSAFEIPLFNSGAYPHNSEPIQELLSLWGTLYSNPGDPSIPAPLTVTFSSEAVTSAAAGPGEHMLAFLSMGGLVIPGPLGMAWSTWAGFGDALASPQVGHALVREPQVFSEFSLSTEVLSTPEPATGLLLLSGLVATGLARRRKYRAGSLRP